MGVPGNFDMTAHQTNAIGDFVIKFNAGTHQICLAP